VTVKEGGKENGGDGGYGDNVSATQAGGEVLEAKKVLPGAPLLWFDNILVPFLLFLFLVFLGKMDPCLIIIGR
jgi:hypothetical protein